MVLPRTLSVEVDRIARGVLGKDWGLYAALLEHWPEIVGTEYAHLTTPVKMTFPPRQKEAQRQDGTLVIRLPKGLAMEFSFKIAQIKQRITDFFGSEVLTKITFEFITHTPCPAPRAPKTTADAVALAALKDATRAILDDDLRGALEALGTSVLTAQKRVD